MKDAFESDDSYLIFTEDAKDDKLLQDSLKNGDSANIRNSDNPNSEGDNVNSSKFKKISKKKKDFQWKIMWVRQ